MTAKMNRLQTKMVDVGGKADTQRTATARGVVRLRADVAQMILDGRIPKGNVFEVARVAGIMAAKNTPGIIPLCHPLNITNVEVDFQFEDRGSKIEDRRTTVLVTATVRCIGKTGVEMEALTAVSAAALTIYDMCKTVQKDLEITDIYLLTKSGGKSGDYRRKKE